MTGVSGAWTMGPDQPHTWQSGPRIGSCAICGAAVSVKDAERHATWHEMQEGGEPIPDLVDRLRSQRENMSLRDDVAVLLARTVGSGGCDDLRRDGLADAVLARVRRHVEALPGKWSLTAPTTILRDDVLRLLGGDDD